MSGVGLESMERLMPRILPQVLPCPRSMALDAVQIVAADFCRRTGAWPVVLQESVFAGDCRIGLNPPKGVVIAEVAALYLDGEPVDKADYVPSPQEIVLRFTPARDALATIKATARPSRTATLLPEEVLEEWGDILAFGVLAKLKSMSGAGIEWTDAQGAAMNLNLYEEGCCRAKTRIYRRGRGGGSLYITGE